MRDLKSIEADLARLAFQRGPGVGTVAAQIIAEPAYRLAGDVAPLLAEVTALRTENERLAGINAALVRDYNHILPLVQPQEIRDAHDFWCDAPKCAGPCNCERPRRITEDELRAELAAERARHETTRAKVRAVEMLHCWTNEDGRRFVFADDLAVALQIPGALAASPSPVAGQDQPKEPTP